MQYFEMFKVRELNIEELLLLYVANLEVLKKNYISVHSQKVRPSYMIHQQLWCRAVTQMRRLVVRLSTAVVTVPSKFIS
jgi:hypothetical protein